MPINEYTCPHCHYNYDTPNHEYGCTKGYEKFNYFTDSLEDRDDNYQLPAVDPEENWEDYRDDLETDGELDPEKVKQFAAAFEWGRQNNIALLTSGLQHEFSKPHTHASWVAAAIRQSFHDEKMYEVEELLEIIEGGGFEEDADLIETVKNYFNYDEWKENNE